MIDLCKGVTDVFCMIDSYILIFFWLNCVIYLVLFVKVKNNSKNSEEQNICYGDAVWKPE